MPSRYRSLSGVIRVDPAGRHANPPAVALFHGSFPRAKRAAPRGGGMKLTKHTIPVGKVFGIPVDLDYSWFLIFGLLTWMLAVGYFPVKFKGWSVAEYWVIGAIASAMLPAPMMAESPTRPGYFQAKPLVETPTAR